VAKLVSHKCKNLITRKIRNEFVFIHSMEFNKFTDDKSLIKIPSVNE